MFSDLELTANRLQKFALQVFAGNDERKKKRLLEGMENLMNPNATILIKIKRPIEVADIISEAKRIKLTSSKVPNEIWLKIMSYLKNKDIFGNFALVNKHFHDLSLDPSAVKYLYLEDGISKAKSKELYKSWMKVIKRSKTLLKLTIRDNNKGLDWNELIKETLFANQRLTSLKIRGESSLLRLTPKVAEALKLTKNLQHFQSKYFELSQEILDVFCHMKSLKRLIIVDSRQNNTQISPDFVERLAYSNNPLEYFYTNTFQNFGDMSTRSKAISILFEKKQQFLKRIVDGFKFISDSHHLRMRYGLGAGLSHENGYQLPNFGQCKNLEEFCGKLSFHDLELILDLPNLKTLLIESPRIDSIATYLKQFHQMNFSNLRYLRLNLITNSHDIILRELAKIPFPSLNFLIVTTKNNNRSHSYISVTEKSVQKLITNLPNLKCLQFCKRMMAEISQEFILKALKDENVIILLDLYISQGARIHDKISLKKAGKSLFAKFQSMKEECFELMANYIWPLEIGEWLFVKDRNQI